MRITSLPILTVAMLWLASCATMDRMQTENEATPTENAQGLTLLEDDTQAIPEVTENVPLEASSSEEMVMLVQEPGEQRLIATSESEASTEALTPSIVEPEISPEVTPEGSEATQESDEMVARDNAVELEGASPIQASENLGISPESLIPPLASPQPIPVTTHKKSTKPKEKMKLDSQPSHSSSLIPEIPTHAIERGGVLLNRFYILRERDNPQGVSRIIYGPTTDRMKELLSWNADNTQWKPGRIIYYSSLVSPNDRMMHSFPYERSIPLEEYMVKEGESLSIIAEKMYGNKNSWTEIAVLNRLRNPDSLKVGEKLVLYPNDMTSLAVADNLGEETDAEESQKKESTPVETPAEKVLAPDLSPTPVAQSPQNETELANPEVGGFFIKNVIPLSIVGVLFILLTIILTWRRVKKGGSYTEF